MGSRKYPYPTRDDIHVLSTPPLPKLTFPFSFEPSGVPGLTDLKTSNNRDFKLLNLPRCFS